MATCVPNTVLAQAAGFLATDTREGKLCAIALLNQLDPASTVSSLLSGAAVFQSCDAKALKMIEVQLLCNIQG